MIEPVADYRALLLRSPARGRSLSSGFQIEVADYVELCELTRVVDRVRESPQAPGETTCS